MNTQKNRLFKGCLAFISSLLFSGNLFAQTVQHDTLSWTWEVTSTVSTQTKTCALEFDQSLIVDWGDGVKDTIQQVLSGEVITHVYKTVGDFVCLARGANISYFKADSRRVKQLVTDKSPHLKYISCTSNQLSALNVFQNKMLETLYCGGNNLSKLQVDSCTSLQTLTCSDNSITALDFSKLLLLKKITCHTNLLTDLKVSPHGALNYLSTGNNKLSVKALDTLFSQLPVLKESGTTKNLLILNNPGAPYCNLSVAISKKWTPDASITTSSMYIPTVHASILDTTLVQLFMTNPTPIIAFETNLVLPRGFVLDTLQTKLNASRKGNHLLSIARTPPQSNTYKLMAYSLTSHDVFRGNSGAIVDLICFFPDSVQQSKIELRETVLVDTSTNISGVTVSDGILIVEPPFVMGDANGDKTVDVTDIVNLVAYINGRNPIGFQSVAADLDRNGKWNVADITKMVLLINTATGGAQSSVPQNRNASSQFRAYKPLEYASQNNLYVRMGKTDKNLLEICLDQKDSIQACQLDLILPKGIRMNESQCQLAENRMNGHRLILTKMDESRYRMLIFSMKPDMALKGDTGALVGLPLQMSEDMYGDEYQIYTQTPVLTGMDRTTVQSNTFDAVLRVEPFNTDQSVIVSSNQSGQILVTGKDIKQVGIFDLFGRIQILQTMNPTSYQCNVVPGWYVVRVETFSGVKVIRKIWAKGV